MDILICLLFLDIYVELYNGGIILLLIFKDMLYDNDILVRIIIKKDNRKVFYLIYRMSVIDILIFVVVVLRLEDKWEIVLGVRF